MGFGENLRALRTARGWSENELARRSSVGQGTINRLETAPNPNPTMRILMKLAQALEVSLDTIAANENSEGLADRLTAIERRLDALEGRPR